MKTMRSTYRRRGFTLVELVVSMTVGVIISGSAGLLIWNAARIRTEVAGRTEIADSAAAALECLVRYVREIPQDECPGNPSPCLLGHSQVSTATATEIRFGNTGFRLNGSQLEMTLNGAANWYPVAKDVSEFSLAYYSRTGTALSSFPLSQADRESIRRIHITLGVTRSSTTVKVRTGIYLRSFMDEVTTVP